MKGRGSWCDQLSPILFWDVDRKTVDPGTHARWLIERVLEKGQWEDWLLLRDNMGRDAIAKEEARLHIDPKARNFLERYLWKS